MAVMVRPVRIQLSRRRGFRLQEVSNELNGLPAVKVARPSVFGNPFKIGEINTRTGQPMSARECVDLYERGLIAAKWSWIGGPLSLFHERQNDLYREWESRTPHLTCVEMETLVPRLRGKNLACFCKLSDPCHADVLLSMANENWPGVGAPSL